MKKSRIMSLLMTVILLMTACISPVLAEVAEEGTITINLKTATDEELAQLMQDIAQEQRSRIVTKLSLDQESITIQKGKSQKLSTNVTDLSENVKVSKTVWSSSNDKIAKVQNGTVSGAGSGHATITCNVLLSDGIELSASCDVTVIVAATSLSIPNANNISIGIGQTRNLDVTIKPDDVSSKKLSYTSADSNIVSIDSNGKMTANHGGKTTITVSTTDGSNKTAKATVYVPSVSATRTEYTVSQKSGLDISVDYYGTRNNLSVTGGGSNASISSSLSENKLTIHVTPIKAGNTSITVSDKSDPKSKVNLKVTIGHDAVYDSTSYPAIHYDDSARYPNSYKGKNVSFSGKVLQVINGTWSTSYRISSRGNYKNVVYVTISNSDITTPIIEDDKVTVYGTYDGNYTYKSIFGAQITIPSVDAERINVK